MGLAAESDWYSVRKTAAAFRSRFFGCSGTRSSASPGMSSDILADYFRKIAPSLALPMLCSQNTNHFPQFLGYEFIGVAEETDRNSFRKLEAFRY
jgi:hypothetical protein